MNDAKALLCQAAGEQVLNFFAALDERRHDDVAALMASDGVWYRQGRELIGPQAVAQALAQRDPARETAHVVSNLRAEMTGPDSARLRFYLLAYDGRSGDDAPRLVAIRFCEDELRHTSAGWRFTKRSSQRHLPPEAR
ncbi:nuclear transport factor 2 family protein [Bordetella avium]|uniref:SnoaL-like domain-containing protein n=1 Tax=Bordetella avium (strain 197N) TaxID=360910 RepID=Q2KXG4_BORA1|nr:nuclear transport factor 2 family protein [Bordetella avium]AZY48213.1 nuclear transport factor 2 family protein [Bordetella avium]AZY51594.1 nuclear transport factor 2 family protein [Bordetella avium]RIQ13542.1 nuclear transport factor 2 family protein [Bordetella avium]RIQ16504.1 nuclear transport factor 2 family protein [Bordetella avium]RIQ31262.1 nuclear transport factor 2 family protein [Bordetella avium]